LFQGSKYGIGRQPFKTGSNFQAAGWPIGQPHEDMAMARKSTEHPDYHFIKVVMTNGTEFTTRSTYGKEGDSINLDIDPSTHPAWTGGTQQLLDRGGRLSRFNSKFGNMAFKK
jgi:large subunit ribosomal protein L31